MSVRSLLSTNQPAGIILLRASVASVLALEGARLCALTAAVGPSRLASIFHLTGFAAPALGVLLLACAAALLAGLGTRIAAAIALLIAGAAAHTAHADFGQSDTAREIADIVSSCAVGLISLYLVIHGAGVWSIDATLGLPKRE